MLQANTRLTERINAELEAEAGLPLSWFEVLAKISWAPESCSRMSALADDLLLSRGGTTRLIARMEEAGLVRREIPPDDRRATYAHVTEKGQEALERAMPIHMAKVDEYFQQHLSDEEVEVLARGWARSCAGSAPTSTGCWRTSKPPPRSRLPPAWQRRRFSPKPTAACC